MIKFDEQALDHIASLIADRVAARLAERPVSQPPVEREIWLEEEVAEHYRLKKATLEKWRQEGRIKATSGRPVTYTAAQKAAVGDYIASRQ